MIQKRIVVAGSSGFIGGHLVRFLKSQGHQVFGMDIVPPQYEQPTEFWRVDLRKEQEAWYCFMQVNKVDEVYNLACLMGGMGFIGNPANDYDVIVGSTRIAANVLECSRVVQARASFFSSSACVYNQAIQEDPLASLKETDAYPANPDLVYGWQKLFSEQMYLASKMNTPAVRIARFHNIFGPEGTFQGGKEKAPAAICRKVALAKEGEEIEIWGDGHQRRSFLYVDECIEGVDRLMQSEVSVPINIGSDESVTINNLARLIIEISGKQLTLRNVEGPRGVMGRNSNNEYIRQVLGWAPSRSLVEGLRHTYSWINQQVNQ